MLQFDIKVLVCFFDAIGNNREEGVSVVLASSHKGECFDSDGCH